MSLPYESRPELRIRSSSSPRADEVAERAQNHRQHKNRDDRWERTKMITGIAAGPSADGRKVRELRNGAPGGTIRGGRVKHAYIGFRCAEIFFHQETSLIRGGL